MRFRRESREGLARGGWSGPLWKITKLYVYLGITGMIDPPPPPRKSQNNIYSKHSVSGHHRPASE